MKRIILMPGSLIILLAACSSITPVVFNKTMQEPFTPGKVAVICGYCTDDELAFARNISRNLNGGGTLTSMNQEEISRRIPAYPAGILEDDFGDKIMTSWISENNKSKIDRIQTKLKTEYILLVWLSGWQSRSGSYGNETGLYVFSRLLKYPGGTVVGYSLFPVSADAGFLGTESDWIKAKESVLQNAAQQISLKLK